MFHSSTVRFVGKVVAIMLLANANVSARESRVSSMRRGGVSASCVRAFGIGVLAQAVIVLLLAFGLAVVAPQCAEAAASTTKTAVKIGNAKFTMKLARTDAAAAFCAYLSKKRTFRMSELNDNEKYRYLSKSFPESSKRYKKVRAGDVMLYGDDCLVIFYKTHKSSYHYTKIGRLTSTKGLAKAVGKKSVKVRFAKMKQVRKKAKSSSVLSGGKAPASGVTATDA